MISLSHWYWRYSLRYIELENLLQIVYVLLGVYELLLELLQKPAFKSVPSQLPSRKCTGIWPQWHRGCLLTASPHRAGAGLMKIYKHMLRKTRLPRSVQLLTTPYASLSDNYSGEYLGYCTP